MIRTVVVVGTLLLGVGAVVAQQDLVNQAQSRDEGQRQRTRARWRAMVKGDKPYDQATVDAALAKQFEDTIRQEVSDPVPGEQSKGMKAPGRLQRSSSDKVWDDKAGFDAHTASSNLCQGRDRRQGLGQGSGYAEGGVSGDRQIMRWMPRNLPRQEQLNCGRPCGRRDP